MRTIFMIMLAVVMLSGRVHAICLSDCGSLHERPRDTSIGYMADSVRYRENSHDTGDVKNSVMGDVNIHVGHKKMDVKIDKGSRGNSVNASVSSTIILGDMKQ